MSPQEHAFHPLNERLPRPSYKEHEHCRDTKRSDLGRVTQGSVVGGKPSKDWDARPEAGALLRIRMDRALSGPDEAKFAKTCLNPNHLAPSFSQLHHAPPGSTSHLPPLTGHSHSLEDMKSTAQDHQSRPVEILRPVEIHGGSVVGHWRQLLWRPNR